MPQSILPKILQDVLSNPQSNLLFLKESIHIRQNILNKSFPEVFKIETTSNKHYKENFILLEDNKIAYLDESACKDIRADLQEQLDITNSKLNPNDITIEYEEFYTQTFSLFKNIQSYPKKYKHMLAFF